LHWFFGNFVSVQLAKDIDFNDVQFLAVCVYVCVWRTGLKGMPRLGGPGRQLPADATAEQGLQAAPQEAEEHRQKHRTQRH
jgi:hypothetical protein